MEEYKRYLEVDGQAIRHNLEVISRQVGVPVMAVIKGNAYGHGAVPVAKLLAAAGVEWFGVEFLEEGVELRKAGVDQRILCLTGPISARECQAFIEYGITPTVYNLDMALLLDEAARERDMILKVHLKLDTGMGRFGFMYKDLEDVIPTLKGLSHLEYEGAFTHFSAVFAKKPDYTLFQLAQFNQSLDKLKQGGIDIALRHAANSVAAMDFPEARLDMVRVGGALFGVSMFKNRDVKLKKAARLKAAIMDIKELPKGAYIGYGRAYKASRPMRVGIIPLGYFEGLKVQRRNYMFHFVDLLRNIYHEIQAYLKPAPLVFKDGKPLKILGRIALQLTVVDLSDVDAHIGDEVAVAIDPMHLDASVPRVYKE